jgi:hypothetical protein
MHDGRRRMLVSAVREHVVQRRVHQHADRLEELRRVRARLQCIEECHRPGRLRRRRVLGSGSVVRRRMVALLGQPERRMRDADQPARHVRRLYDRVPCDGAEMLRVRQQLHVCHGLLRADADAVRIDLRRHEQQCLVLRQLHDRVHRGNDVPEQPVQVSRRHGRLQRHVRGPQPGEQLRERWCLRCGMSRTDGWNGSCVVQRGRLRDLLLFSHVPAVWKRLRQYVERREQLWRLPCGMQPIRPDVLGGLVRVHCAVVPQRLLHGQHLRIAERVRRVRVARWDDAWRTLRTLRQRIAAVLFEQDESRLQRGAESDDLCAGRRALLRSLLPMLLGRCTHVRKRRGRMRRMGLRGE